MEPAPDLGARLAPHAVLLRRSETELQIGVDPSLVVPRSYEPFVRSLFPDVPTEPWMVEDSSIPAHSVHELFSSLERARLLRPSRPASQTGVRLVGAGPLGVRTAHELVRAGFGSVYLADLPDHHSVDGRDAPGRGRRPGSAHPPHRLEQLAASLSRTADGVRVRRSRHFLKPEGAAVALTLVVADGPEPDRLVTDLLREHGAPHLLLRSSGDEVTVGPLVVPGATSCVRCGDLVRRDLDDRWPWLLEQLTRLPLTPSPTLLGWAATTATVQALAFVGGGSPEALGHTLELRDDDHTMRLRTWPRHPECPCREV